MQSNSGGLVGASDVHRTILDTLTRVARTDAEVLITGPTGVGKELYAQHVHAQSHRAANRFVPINCGSLSEGLLENELFGHVGGAFTGARAQHEGLVHEAEGGTLFLDEVNSLSVPCQIKLLRFLQDRRYRRLGDTRLREADVRIVAAANVDLADAVQQREFREDLFFRLRVVPVEIPPLRDRPEDVPSLVTAFIERCAHKYGTDPIYFSDAAMERLLLHTWPGNVRELENTVAYLTCMQLGRPILPADMPLVSTSSAPVSARTGSPFVRGDDRDLDGDAPGEHTQAGDLSEVREGFQEAKSRIVEDFERSYIRKALVRSQGNVAAAARLSGKNRRALFELMRKHEIDPSAFRKAKEDGEHGVVVRSMLET